VAERGTPFGASPRPADRGDTRPWDARTRRGGCHLYGVHAQTAECLSSWNGFQINPPADPDAVRKELEQIALGDAPSGRAKLAKVTALRTLEKLARPADDDSYPVDDDGRFFAGPPEAWDLYRCDSDETRERWRENWQRQRGRRGR
jgi:hypothetical protein